MNQENNITTNPEATYTQLCVIHGVTLKESSANDFVMELKHQLNCDFKFAEEVVTNVKCEDGENRRDLLFYVADEDINKFAVPRFMFGIRWWEDVIKYNNHADDYPQEVLDKYPVTW